MENAGIRNTFAIADKVGSRLKRTGCTTTTTGPHVTPLANLQEGMLRPADYVRFTPNGRHYRSANKCPLCAKSGHMQCSKKVTFNAPSAGEAPRIFLCASSFRRACWRPRPELADMEPNRRSRKHNMLPASAAKSHRNPYIRR